MTLLKNFNEKLEDLPTISDFLEKLIRILKWPEEKSQQAIEIIEQLKNTGLIKIGECMPYNCVVLTRLTITLSPRECGIDNDTFEPENMSQADNYIRDLLLDINHISEDIKFSFGGHSNYKNGKCTFEICWEI